MKRMSLLMLPQQSSILRPLEFTDLDKYWKESWKIRDLAYLDEVEITVPNRITQSTRMDNPRLLLALRRTSASRPMRISNCVKPDNEGHDQSELNDSGLVRRCFPVPLVTWGMSHTYYRLRSMLQIDEKTKRGGLTVAAEDGKVLLIIFLFRGSA